VILHRGDVNLGTSCANFDPKISSHCSTPDPKSSTAGTWVCPSGTDGLVYQVRPIKEVENYKDSQDDLETKKEGSNMYSTRTLVKPSPVAYIRLGRGAPRGTTYDRYLD
jgi:hypothetical protein